MVKNGLLTLMDLSDREREVFLNYLESVKGIDSIQYLDAEFGNDLTTFLDLFAGETIRIPSKNELITLANYSIIYAYLENRNFSKDAYQRASHLFKRRVPALEKIVDKMSGEKEEEQENV